MQRRRRELDVPRFEQPDDVTCGPTCLMQVMRHYGDPRPYSEILASTPRNPDGGTQAVFLGMSAIRSGYRARIYPYNLRIFDPTWADLPRAVLVDKLAQRAGLVQKRKLAGAIEAYRSFLDLGGTVHFDELTAELLIEIIDRGRPILCGLSSTYLYQQTRERPDDNKDDDVGGEPTGHFVVICGYTGAGRHFIVRDPASHVPFSKTGRYRIPAPRLINSILLGDVTYDAVLLELSPRHAFHRRDER